MTIPIDVRRIARASLSVVAPLRCVICGGAVEPELGRPLCGACGDEMLDGLRLDTEGQVPRCGVCGKRLISERGACMRCRSVAFGFDSAYPLFRYAGTVRSAVLAYKSGRRRSLASFFAQAIAGVLESRYPGRVVVPVPPRPGKRRRKGWDQVEDIAGILERRHGVTVARVLVRADGLEQKALDLEGRAANMRGRIRVKDRLAPRKLLGRPRTCGSAAGTVPVPRAPVLLDDVLTTGATLSACASALKAAGAARVDAVAIAAD